MLSKTKTDAALADLAKPKRHISRSPNAETGLVIRREGPVSRNKDLTTFLPTAIHDAFKSKDLVPRSVEAEMRILFELDQLHGSDRIMDFSREHQVEAFEAATSILNRISLEASEMAIESAQAIALIAARTERIDREQAANRRMLNALISGKSE